MVSFADLPVEIINRILDWYFTGKNVIYCPFEGDSRVEYTNGRGNTIFYTPAEAWSWYWEASYLYCGGTQMTETRRESYHKARRNLRYFESQRADTSNLFANVAICKGLVSREQVEIALLKNATISIIDQEYAEEIRVMKPSRRSLVKHLLLGGKYNDCNWNGLEVDGTIYASIPSLSSVVMRSPMSGELLVHSASSIFPEASGVTPDLCYCRGHVHNHYNSWGTDFRQCECLHPCRFGWQKEEVYSNKPNIPQIERDMGRAWAVTRGGMTLARWYVDNWLYRNWHDDNGPPLGKFVKEAVRGGVEIVLQTYVLVRGDFYNYPYDGSPKDPVYVSPMISCLWSILLMYEQREARFTTNDMIFRILHGGEEICIPQEFGQDVPEDWPHIGDNFPTDLIEQAKSTWCQEDDDYMGLQIPPRG